MNKRRVYAIVTTLIVVIVLSCSAVNSKANPNEGSNCPIQETGNDCDAFVDNSGCANTQQNGQTANGASLGSLTQGDLTTADIPAIDVNNNENANVNDQCGGQNNQCTNENNQSVGQDNQCTNENNQCGGQNNQCTNENNQSGGQNNQCTNGNSECGGQNNQCTNGNSQSVGQNNQCTNGNSQCGGTNNNGVTVETSNEETGVVNTNTTCQSLGSLTQGNLTTADIPVCSSNIQDCNENVQLQTIEATNENNSCEGTTTLNITAPKIVTTNNNANKTVQSAKTTNNTAKKVSSTTNNTTKSVNTTCASTTQDTTDTDTDDETEDATMTVSGMDDETTGDEVTVNEEKVPSTSGITKTKAPKTFDNFKLALIIMMLVITGGSILIFYISSRKVSAEEQ